ncbi:MAG: beta family protein [Dyella sp.]|uniref:beta family protein n=1 Tax=Dyella sp. TaxID=1869338 RepID=UPI003F7CFDA7
MRISYTPFFHAKDGEFTALQHSKAEQRAVTLPLFEIGRFTESRRKLVRFKNDETPMCAYLNWVADSICDAFPSGPVMVDTFSWLPAELTETGEVPVSFAIHALVEREREVVPVVGLDRWEDETYRLALKGLNADDFETWAVRLDTADIEDAADPEHFLERMDEVLQELGLTASQTGVLLDFGDVTGKTDDQIEAEARRVLDLLGPNGYRFYSLIGCSMPPTINLAVKQPNSQGDVIRKEMTAWRRLRAAYPALPIAYGDYGVRGPTSSDIPNPHTNGKIRYTYSNAFFVARGQSVKNDDGSQMYRLANTVASSEHYQGPSFSWGDSELYRRAIREKNVGPGNSNKWIMFDTSHHLAWVILEIAEIERALRAVPVTL